MEGMDDLVLHSWVWVGEVVWAEANDITDEDHTGLSGEDPVASIVLESWAKVEAFQRTEVPGLADGRFVVDENMASGRAHGSGIEEVGPKEGFPCRWFGRVCGRAEQMEGEFRLWEEQVPSIRREGGCGARKDGQEVVLERADGPLRRIMSVDMGGNKLESAMVSLDGL